MDKNLLEEIQAHRYSDFEVLNGEPARFARYSVYLMMLMLSALLVWSVLAKAPVVVKANGTLKPKSDIKRIYTPVGGYVSEILLSVGQPVKANDIVMRIRSNDVFERSKNYEQARLKYESTLQRRERNREERPTLLSQIERTEKSIADIDEELQRQQRDRKFRLSQIQQLRLDRINENIKSTAQAKSKALETFRSLERLFKEGAVSERELNEGRSQYNQRKQQHDTAKNSLLEYELNLSSESRQEREALRSLGDRLDVKNRERDELYAKQREMDRVDRNIESEIRLAKLELDVAAQISFDDIDSNGLLLIRSPIDGVISSNSVTQSGQLVDATRHLAEVAPVDSEKVLSVLIPEKDRLFLREGMSVRVKFNAMDYRRFGVADGLLRYISPITQRPAQGNSNNTPTYSGVVEIQREGLTLGENFYALQYGMQATAEVIVRNRRVIDIALDPLRKVVY